MAETAAERTDAQAGPANADKQAEVLNLLIQLCEQFGWKSNGRPWTGALARRLNEVTCESRILHELMHPEERDSQKFDSYYAAKSRFGTLKIVDTLKTRLLEEGLNVAVGTEYKADFGVYDVAILLGNPVVLTRFGQPALKIEIKGSLGIPLEQLDRYSWGDSPLILARIATGHVALLRPEDMESFAAYSMVSTVQKARRLAAVKPVLIPGADCSGCRAKLCPHFRTGKSS